MLEGGLSRLGQRFKPGSHGHGNGIAGAFRPIPAGIALALLAWLYDANFGTAQSGSMLEVFADLVSGDEQNFALAAGTFSLALSMLFVGSELGSPLRTLFAKPLVELTHHLAMVGLGAFLVIAPRDLIKSWSLLDFFLALYITFVLLWLGVWMAGASVALGGERLRRLEKMRLFRWVSIGLGLFMLNAALSNGRTIADNILAKHVQMKQCEEAAKEKAAAARRAGSEASAASTPSAAPSKAATSLPAGPASTAVSAVAPIAASNSTTAKGGANHE